MYHKRLHVGDRLILCSDGLTRHVRPEEIAEIALSDSNPDVVSQKLIDLANERGGEDNVSVIVISVEGTQQSRPPVDQAVIASEIDEEATLILKERPYARSGDAADTLPVVPPDFNEQFNQAGSESRSDDHKMSAERLKDEGVEPGHSSRSESASPVDAFLQSALAHRPDRLVEAVTLSAAPRRETQGEGRDTLLPDQ
jgi:hypothetical protein